MAPSWRRSPDSTAPRRRTSRPMERRSPSRSTIRLPQIATMQVDGTGFHIITNDPIAAKQPRWSPDGPVGVLPARRRRHPPPVGDGCGRIERSPDRGNSPTRGISVRPTGHPMDRGSSTRRSTAVRRSWPRSPSRGAAPTSSRPGAAGQSGGAWSPDGVDRIHAWGLDRGRSPGLRGLGDERRRERRASTGRSAETRAPKHPRGRLMEARSRSSGPRADLSKRRRSLRGRRRVRRDHRGPPWDGDRTSTREPADLDADGNTLLVMTQSN